MRVRLRAARSAAGLLSFVAGAVLSGFAAVFSLVIRPLDPAGIFRV